VAKSAQIARLEERLKRLPARVVEDLQPALIKSGEDLAAMMRREAPVDEGDLRESITVTRPGQSTPPYSQPGGAKVAGPLEVRVTAGNAETRYPNLVEYGTAHAPAQPFFWPSLRALQQRILNRTKRAGRKAIRDYWGGK
jgi:HK97 gp10 family phage protein